jgi:hypothetical protein
VVAVRRRTQEQAVDLHDVRCAGHQREQAGRTTAVVVERDLEALASQLLQHCAAAGLTSVSSATSMTTALAGMWRWASRSRTRFQEAVAGERSGRHVDGEEQGGFTEPPRLDLREAGG